MFLSRIHLDFRGKEARRDLADPYQLHSTLCRAFSPPEIKCPEGKFLWRLEPEADSAGHPRVLVQSKEPPNWAGIQLQKWLADADKPLDLKEKLKFDFIKEGQLFRFRLRANPCVMRNGKRLGLFRPEEQEAWLIRKGQQHGFSLPRSSFGFAKNTQKNIDVCISQQKMLQGKQHSGNTVRIFSAFYDGMLTVSNPVDFKKALESGVGHGKTLGLGLLSVIPLS